MQSLVYVNLINQYDFDLKPDQIEQNLYFLLSEIKKIGKLGKIIE